MARKVGDGDGRNSGAVRRGIFVGVGSLDCFSKREGGGKVGQD